MKNIEGSIVIGIGMEAACRADEGRLVFAASTVHSSVARTRLRGKWKVRSVKSGIAFLPGLNAGVSSGV